MTTFTRTSAARTVPVALLMAVAAAACGGSSSAAGSGPATAPATSPAVTPPAGTPSASPSKAPPADKQLASLILTSRDVSTAGVAVTLQQMQGGTEVQHQVTLDLCNAKYPSEALRVARYQVLYVALPSSNPALNGQSNQVAASNELVRYGPKGASQAYGELRKAARTCPTSIDLGGGAVETKVATASHDGSLASRQLTVTSLVTPKAGKRIWSAATYQFVGNLFSGVYVYRGTKAQALQAARSLGAIAYSKLKSGGSTTV